MEFYRYLIQHSENILHSHIGFDTIIYCLGNSDNSFFHTSFTHTPLQHCSWNMIKWFYQINKGKVGVMLPNEIFPLHLGEYGHYISRLQKCKLPASTWSLIIPLRICSENLFNKLFKHFSTRYASICIISYSS